MLIRSVTAAIALVATTHAAAVADTILVNETFTDGNLTGGDDASGSAWYGEDALAALAIESKITANSLRFSSTGNNRSAHGIFSGVTLSSPGHWIELTFDVQFDAGFPDQRDGFQFGLWNSNGTHVNGTNPSSANIGNDTGFEATINADGGTNDGTVNEVGGTNNLGRYNIHAAGTTTHSLTLRLERVGALPDDSIAITVSGDLINASGNAVVRSDASPVTFTFDQVVFEFSGSNVGGPVWLDNVLVTTNVPEPSTVSFAVLAVVACLAPRRR